MTAAPAPEAIHVDANPVAAADKAAASIHLDGDEVVQLSIKPSLWHIPLVSAQVVLPMALLAVIVAIAWRGGWSQGALVFPLAVVVGILRIALASLQWASQLYVLTNRRVMRFRGVLSVNVAECPLSKVNRVELRTPWHQRLLRLGSIVLTPADPQRASVTWELVARPKETHELLVRAIRKSQSSPN
ncbi:MAG: PH domain-containing protein [Planctomycetes bacterium]|nr:PH domain-containing protein [Planctomycetota bacterium]